MSDTTASARPGPLSEGELKKLDAEYYQACTTGKVPMPEMSLDTLRQLRDYQAKRLNLKSDRIVSRVMGTSKSPGQAVACAPGGPGQKPIFRPRNV